MKNPKIANRFYSIDKAEKIVSVEKTFGEKYGVNPDDDWTETLYRKSNGEFFVYGKGGKNTPFCTYEDGEEVAGSRYVTWTAYNDNEAKNWAFTNCPDKVKEIFQQEEEDDGKKSVTTFYLTKKARKNIKRKALEKGIGFSELVNSWAETLYK